MDLGVKGEAMRVLQRGEGIFSNFMIELHGWKPSEGVC